MQIANPHLSKGQDDYLYHLGTKANNPEGLGTQMDLKGMFGDTKFVCMGGSSERMHKFAKRLLGLLNVQLEGAWLLILVGTDLVPIGKTERFSLYKVGPVISVNHGMGFGSCSILLHEITKVPPR